jgi:hypothetical protein
MRGQSAARTKGLFLFAVARRKAIYDPTIRALAILFAGLVAASCGGGGNGGRSIAGVGITISPSVASVEAGDTQQFTATVTGTTNTAVTWSVNDVEGGDATVGTISPTGLYTAPAAVPSPDTVSAKATSVADSAKSASAQVTITPPILRLTSLAPLTVIRSSADFDLDVYGHRFSATTQVVFNGTPEPTTYLGDSTQLTARISSTDIALAGSYSVVVQDNDQTTNALNFYVVPPVLAQDVQVAAGGTTNEINIAVTPASAPALALLAVGEGNTAGGTGMTLLQGGTADLFLAGRGIVPGTFYMIAGDSQDIAVTQPLAADFQTAHDQDGNPIPAVTVQISALPNAALGPRNILVTNPDGEISVFVGGVFVSAGP